MNVGLDSNTSEDNKNQHFKNISLIYTLRRRYSHSCSDAIRSLHTKRLSKNNGLNNELAEFEYRFFEERIEKGVRREEEKEREERKKGLTSRSLCTYTKNHWVITIRRTINWIFDL